MMYVVSFFEQALKNQLALRHIERQYDRDPSYINNVKVDFATRIGQVESLLMAPEFDLDPGKTEYLLFNNSLTHKTMNDMIEMDMRVAHHMLKGLPASRHFDPAEYDPREIFIERFKENEFDKLNRRKNPTEESSWMMDAVFDMRVRMEEYNQRGHFASVAKNRSLLDCDPQ